MGKSLARLRHAASRPLEVDGGAGETTSARPSRPYLGPQDLLSTAVDNDLAYDGGMPTQPDGDALVQALLAHRDDVLRVATAITGRAEDAEEVLQEVLLRGLHAAPATDRPLRPWVLKVTRNLAIDRVRSRAAGERAAAAEPDPAAPVGLEDLGQALARLLSGLTEPQRAVVLARDVLGASVDEVAAALGVSAASVKNLHLRARRALEAAEAPDPSRSRAELEALLVRSTSHEAAPDRPADPLDRRFPAWFAGDLATRLAVLAGAVDLAVEVGDAALAARALWSRGLVRGRIDASGARDDLSRAAVLASEAAPALSGGIGLSLGVVQAYQGDLREAAPTLEGAAEALAEHDAPGQAAALAHLGWVEAERGALEVAAEHLQRALEVGGATLSPSGRAVALQHLANLRLLQGRIEEGRALATQAAALARAQGDRHNTAAALANLAMAAADRGDVEQALALLRQGRDLVRAEGNTQQEGVFDANLGVVLQRAGRVDEAASALAEGLALSRRASDRRSVAIARANLGVVAHARGDRGEARRQLGRARAEAEALDLRRLVRFVAAHQALLADPITARTALTALAADAEGAADPRFQRLLAVVRAAIDGAPADPEAEPFTETAIAAAITRSASSRPRPAGSSSR
jgi:RNA polymerase sigma factor (sigma-70 family)